MDAGHASVMSRNIDGIDPSEILQEMGAAAQDRMPSPTLAADQVLPLALGFLGKALEAANAAPALHPAQRGDTSACPMNLQLTQHSGFLARKASKETILAKRPAPGERPHGASHQVFVQEGWPASASARRRRPAYATPTAEARRCRFRVWWSSPRRRRTPET